LEGLRRETLLREVSGADSGKAVGLRPTPHQGSALDPPGAKRPWTARLAHCEVQQNIGWAQRLRVLPIHEAAAFWAAG